MPQFTKLNENQLVMSLYLFKENSKFIKNTGKIKILYLAAQDVDGVQACEVGANINIGIEKLNS